MKQRQTLTAEERNYHLLTRAAVLLMFAVAMILLALVAGMAVTMLYDVGAIPHPFFTG